VLDVVVLLDVEVLDVEVDVVVVLDVEVLLVVLDVDVLVDVVEVDVEVVELVEVVVVAPASVLEVVVDEEVDVVVLLEVLVVELDVEVDVDDDVLELDVVVEDVVVEEVLLDEVLVDELVVVVVTRRRRHTPWAGATIITQHNDMKKGRHTGTMWDLSCHRPASYRLTDPRHSYGEAASRSSPESLCRRCTHTRQFHRRRYDRGP